MSIRSLSASAGLLALACFTPALTASASAAPVIVTLDQSFASTPISFSFEGATFTFSGTGDFFQPTAIQTSDTGAVESFGGFLGFPVTPSTDFPGRGSGILTYGPGTQFASYLSTTVIPYSNGDNYLGLRATLNGQSYYGYAFTTDTTLNGFGFETTPDTAITIDTNPVAAPVPEAATWAMMLMGFGAIGTALRGQKTKIRFA